MFYLKNRKKGKLNKGRNRNIFLTGQRTNTVEDTHGSIEWEKRAPVLVLEKTQKTQVRDDSKEITEMAQNHGHTLLTLILKSILSEEVKNISISG